MLEATWYASQTSRDSPRLTLSQPLVHSGRDTLGPTPFDAARAEPRLASTTCASIRILSRKEVNIQWGRENPRLLPAPASPLDASLFAGCVCGASGERPASILPRRKQCQILRAYSMRMLVEVMEATGAHMAASLHTRHWDETRGSADIECPGSAGPAQGSGEGI